MFRGFVLVCALGCSGEAATRVDSPAEGKSTPVESGGDSALENVIGQTPVESTHAEPQVTLMASTLWVNHYQVPCWGWESKYLCNLVGPTEQGPWEMEYDPIGGVPLQWGHVYEVQLGFVDNEVHYEDAPDISTFVTEIRTDHTVDVGSTSFEFAIDPTMGVSGVAMLSRTSADGGELIDGTPFTCDSRQVCDRLETIFEQADPFVVHFGYVPGLSLVVLSIDG